MTVEKSTSSSISFGSLLTLLFIGLKLTGYINWSWFWVLSPTLLPLIIVGSLLGVFLLIIAVLSIFDVNNA